MRIVIAEDNALLREGLVALVRERGIEVVAVAEDAEGLLRIVDGHKPDLAIVDVRLPPTFTDEGVRAAIELRERFPETGILILSQYVEPVYTAELLATGAGGFGYLLKERVGDVRAFVDAIERVAAGGTALDGEVVTELFRNRDGGGDYGALGALTPREREVLALMAEGRTNAAIARELVVTGGAIEKHISSIFSKLDLPATDDDHRRVLAVLTFLRAGSGVELGGRRGGGDGRRGGDGPRDRAATRRRGRARRRRRRRPRGRGRTVTRSRPPAGARVRARRPDGPGDVAAP